MEEDFVPLWGGRALPRQRYLEMARTQPTGAVSPAHRQGAGVRQSSIPRPPEAGAAASPLAPTPSAHDEEHRVVVAEEHLPK